MSVTCEVRGFNAGCVWHSAFLLDNNVSRICVWQHSWEENRTWSRQQERLLIPGVNAKARCYHWDTDWRLIKVEITTPPFFETKITKNMITYVRYSNYLWISDNSFIQRVTFIMQNGIVFSQKSTAPKLKPSRARFPLWNPALEWVSYPPLRQMYIQMFILFSLVYGGAVGCWIQEIPYCKLVVFSVPKIFVLSWPAAIKNSFIAFD